MEENYTVQDLLYGEMSTLFAKLEDMEPGTDEYKKVNDELVKLTDRAIGMEKFNLEQVNEAQKMKIDRNDRIVKNILTGVSVVGGLALTVWGTVFTFANEKEVPVTTIMGRGFVNKLFPKK